MKTTTVGAIALGLMAVSTLADAHSQQPSMIKEYVTKPVNKFSVELVNRYPKPMCYRIEENGKPSMLADVCLNAGGSRQIDFWVNSKPDEQTDFTICTIPKIKGNIRVRLCSVVKTYYPYSQLAQ
ncbi:MAG: hypothetical protein ACRC2Y_04980 [Aeromonas veronii]